MSNWTMASSNLDKCCGLHSQRTVLMEVIHAAQYDCNSIHSYSLFKICQYCPCSVEPFTHPKSGLLNFLLNGCAHSVAHCCRWPLCGCADLDTKLALKLYLD